MRDLPRSSTTRSRYVGRLELAESGCQTRSRRASRGHRQDGGRRRRCPRLAVSPTTARAAATLRRRKARRPARRRSTALAPRRSARMPYKPTTSAMNASTPTLFALLRQPAASIDTLAEPQAPGRRVRPRLQHPARSRGCADARYAASRGRPAKAERTARSRTGPPPLLGPRASPTEAVAHMPQPADTRASIRSSTVGTRSTLSFSVLDLGSMSTLAFEHVLVIRTATGPGDQDRPAPAWTAILRAHQTRHSRDPSTPYGRAASNRLSDPVSSPDSHRQHQPSPTPMQQLSSPCLTHQPIHRTSQ